MAYLEWVEPARMIEHPWVSTQECVISRAH